MNNTSYGNNAFRGQSNNQSQIPQSMQSASSANFVHMTSGQK